MRWEAVLMNLDKVYNSIEEVLDVAESAEGKKVGYFDTANRLKNKGNKGKIGQVIEEGLFQKSVNSRAEADFIELGLELKVTGIKVNKKKTDFSTKERLVLNYINYNEEYKCAFEDSSFWKKNKNLLIMFYQYDENEHPSEFPIIKTFLHEFSAEDLVIIKQDWETIVDKIKNGEAHNISEGDTLYLGACTKGKNAQERCSQPFSMIPAKPRAFSLKPSYLRNFAHSVLGKNDIPALFNLNDLKSKSLVELLDDLFKPYIGKSAKEISELVGIPLTNNKSINAKIIRALLGVKCNSLDSIEEFSKANIKFKTINLGPNGVPEQNMSFDIIDFNRWVNSSWTESQVYEEFQFTKYLFVVFQYYESKKQNPNRQQYLKGIVLWNMPEDIIENELKQFWVATRKILKEGVELKITPKRVYNNLPGVKFNGVCHIRPKAKDSSIKVLLPDGKFITKQSYWLNKEFINKYIPERLKKSKD